MMVISVVVLEGSSYFIHRNYYFMFLMAGLKGSSAAFEQEGDTGPEKYMTCSKDRGEFIGARC